MGRLIFAAVVTGLAVWPANVRAQSSDDDGGFTVRGSGVGYIDSAVIGNQFRLRLDSAYNFRQPSRAELFYAQGRPGGPGLPLPERSLDYADLSAYLEVACNPGLSGFVEVPVRFLNPEINSNAWGLGDLNVGGKLALWQGDDGLLTFQLRAYAPSGDATRGLGNNHASIEPGLLLYQRLDERLSLAGELRYWAPLGGTEFAGDVLRYGLGLRYDLVCSPRLHVAPVAEFVGWTVLGGKESTLLDSGQVVVEGAAGDTIVNAKLGVRMDFGGPLDFYAGYGRALTGERWYEDVFRLELRWSF